MEQLNSFAKKAVAAAIEEGIITGNDKAGIRAVATMAAAMLAQAKPSLLMDELVDSLYTDLHADFFGK